MPQKPDSPGPAFYICITESLAATAQPLLHNLHSNSLFSGVTNKVSTHQFYFHFLYMVQNHQMCKIGGFLGVLHIISKYRL